MTGQNVGVIPLVWHQMADPIGQPTDLHRAWCPLFKQHFWAESADRIPKIEARRAARIMAVIEIKESDEQMVQDAYDALADRRMDQPTPTLEDALELPEVRALVNAAKAYRIAICSFDGGGGFEGKLHPLKEAEAALDNALAALKGGV